MDRPLRALLMALHGQQAPLLLEAINLALALALPTSPLAMLVLVGIVIMEVQVAFQKSPHLVVDLEVQGMISNPIAQHRASNHRFLRV